MALNSAEPLKNAVKLHWENETCGTRYGGSETDRRAYFEEISANRYRLEPYIECFADFPSAKDKAVLEIGVGAGADFRNWCAYAAHATGVDLTERAIALTHERLCLDSIPPEKYTLLTADTESLPFENDRFDIVYSWGVLHHTPDTRRAFEEAFRVLKPGGFIRAMIYHHPSWTGLMLYLRYALGTGNLGTKMRDIVFNHLESPGTKSYTTAEAAELLSAVGFSKLKLSTKLGPGDLLTITPGRKYASRFYGIVWRFYPRWLVRLIGDRFGLGLLISASKASASVVQPII